MFSTNQANNNNTHCWGLIFPAWSQFFSGTNSFLLFLVAPLKTGQAPKRVPFFSRVTEQLSSYCNLQHWTYLSCSVGSRLQTSAPDPSSCELLARVFFFLLRRCRRTESSFCEAVGSSEKVNQMSRDSFTESQLERCFLLYKVLL